MLFVLYCLAALVGANNMRSKSLRTSSTMSMEDLRASMMEEIMLALGEGNRVTDDRLGAIEGALHPMFNTMPKNEHGHLDHAGVSYLLHRIFVQRHGMFLKGVEPNSRWNESNPTAVFEDKISTYVQSMFEERLRGRGLGLHELSILAATLEHIIHDEAQERLQTAYEAHGFAMDRLLSEEDATSVIDTSLALFILGNRSPKDVKTIRRVIAGAYPGWKETQKFAREVAENVTQANQNDPDFTIGQRTFTSASKIVEEIGERFGRWQDGECRDLKAELLKMEHAGTGRVLLKDFYGHALDGAWQFTESVDYLRELGALDEMRPDRKSVIIANYVNAPSNCIASSGIYSLCCINECEDLLGHVEREVNEPEGTTSSIISAITKLPSSTVQAPREVSAELRSLLGEIASHHNGRVPLHGRLFAQWMHHAYPRECPYPHRLGSTTSMTPDEWMTHKGAEVTASQDVMRDEAESIEVSSTDSNLELAWTLEEELVVSRPTSKSRSWATFFIRIVFLAAVLASMGATLSGTLGSVISRDKKGTPILPYSTKEHSV